MSTRPPSRRDADVVTGVRGADRTLIRLMKPSDDRGLIAAMAGQAIADRPLRPNHPLLTEELSAALVAGSNGTWDTWLQQQQARGADIDEVCWAYAAVLVAERHGAIVGVATLHPPLSLLTDSEDLLDQTTLSRILVSVVKFASLTVAEPFRGRGIGASLIKQARRAYTSCRTGVMFGQIKGDALADYYTARGFTVFGPADALDLSGVAGFDYRLGPGPGERLIARKIASDYPGELRMPGGALTAAWYVPRKLAPSPSSGRTPLPTHAAPAGVSEPSSGERARRKRPWWKVWG